ncbi:hypothetical protein, partial [Ilumatobacter sp.]|uniref:hypothetical protein n=1 Tax=Ilumatobacter sp. TaxID=1967498 RepID=UPI003AF6FE58
MTETSDPNPTAAPSVAARLTAVLTLVAALLAVGAAVHHHPARSAPADLQAVVPARLFESRVGESTVDGVLAGGGRVGAGSV